MYDNSPDDSVKSFIRLTQKLYEITLIQPKIWEKLLHTEDLYRKSVMTKASGVDKQYVIFGCIVVISYSYNSSGEFVLASYHFVLHMYKQSPLTDHLHLHFDTMSKHMHTDTHNKIRYMHKLNIDKRPEMTTVC